MPRIKFPIKARGRTYEVRYLSRAPRVDGDDCDGSCSHREKVIRIDGTIDEDERLESLIHEWFHARFDPDYREDAILIMAEELTEAILTQRKMEGD